MGEGKLIWGGVVFGCLVWGFVFGCLVFAFYGGLGSIVLSYALKITCIKPQSVMWVCVSVCL